MARNPKAPKQDSTPAVPDASILHEGQQPEQPDTPPFRADIQHPKVTAEEAPVLEEGNPTLSDIGDLFPEPGEVVIPADLTEQLLSEKNGPKIAAALQYLQENNLLSYDELEAKAATASERFHALAEQMQQLESGMKTNAALKAAIVDYAKARPVFEQYKASKYSRKFLAEHEGEIALYRAATAQFDSLLNGGKLPKMDKLKAERQELTAKKKTAYKEYRAARSTMQEVLTVKANIDALLGDTQWEKNKEQER